MKTRFFLTKKVLILALFVNIFLFALSQTKQDIKDYLKTRIELYSERPGTKVEFSSCGLKYYFNRTLFGNPPWTQEWSCSLSNLLDVLYINDSGLIMITLKFRSKDISVTDIEQDGTRKFVMLDSDFSFFFPRGTINDDDAKKIVTLFKKLGKQCGAKVLEL